MENKIIDIDASILKEITIALARAKEKHPELGNTAAKAANVATEEYLEFVQAVNDYDEALRSGFENMRQECIDWIVVGIRFLQNIGRY